MSHREIGFVGLGTMGKPMALNLLDAGYSVVGYNRSQEPIDQLIDAGGRGASSPREVGDQADVVILCLPDSEAVTSVALGSDGVVDALGPGDVLIDMSTISPSATRTVARAVSDRDASMLDAPISGGETGAVEGSLSIMVGGDAAVVDANRDLFEVLGETVTHCGPIGTGQTAKTCNQIVVAAQMVAVSEAMVLAASAGADLDSVVEAISGGAAGCWALDNRAPTMVRRDFDPGFFAEYQYKDLRIATEAGESFGVSLPQTSVTHELYKAMAQNEMGKDDHSGVVQIIEQLSGTKACVNNVAESERRDDPSVD